jgi:hypothetical protein
MEFRMHIRQGIQFRLGLAAHPNYRRLDLDSNLQQSSGLPFFFSSHILRTSLIRIGFHHLEPHTTRPG